MVPEKAEYAVVTVPMYPLDVLVKVHVPLHAAAADITFCASVLETLVSMQYLMVVPLACDPPPNLNPLLRICWNVHSQLLPTR